jgi:hypothetical protein
MTCFMLVVISSARNQMHVSHFMFKCTWLLHQSDTSDGTDELLLVTRTETAAFLYCCCDIHRQTGAHCRWTALVHKLDSSSIFFNHCWGVTQKPCIRRPVFIIRCFLVLKCVIYLLCVCAFFVLFVCPSLRIRKSLQKNRFCLNTLRKSCWNNVLAVTVYSHCTHIPI